MPARRAVKYKDYYAILGVDRKATADEIQKAYRQLARKYHPDVNKASDAEHRFKEIGEAYDVLKDEDKRRKYDQYGEAWKAASERGDPGPGYGQGFGGGPPFETVGDIGSFLEQLFGRGGMGGAPGGGGGRRVEWRGGFPGMGNIGFGDFGFGGPQPQPAPPADHSARLRLSLEEAARGGKREISLADGHGKPRTFSVNIPAGVRTGQRIRLAGQGGSARGKRGDLYLEVEIEPHPKFRLDGTDLHTSLDLAPWEAALGAKVGLVTLDGEVQVKVPAGSSSGQQIRLRGKGFPSGKEHG
ncbi:MAG: DnaJ domain-containing protein, partial [Planctomycetes bacterium]|nr:DnaJ domain-containing protein [Planctomycetota bacterium]